MLFKKSDKEKRLHKKIFSQTQIISKLMAREKRIIGIVTGICQNLNAKDQDGNLLASRQSVVNFLENELKSEE